MNKLLSCRRTFLAFAGIICLTFLGYFKDLDVSMAITGIVTAVAASNASENTFKTKFSKDQSGSQG